MLNIAGKFERFPSVPPVDLDLLLADGMSMGEPTLQAAAERQVGDPITIYFKLTPQATTICLYMCDLSVVGDNLFLKSTRSVCSW